MRSHGPGVRFCPTDEQLIMYYLKRKVTRKKFHRDGIRVLDVYKYSPRDLQGQAREKRDLKYYFFCPRGRKYSTGERTNRSTPNGFWKTTGIDRPVYNEGKIVGMIKSLIFHTRKSMERTNWVMHEYKLQDEYVKQLGLKEVLFVLCVIFNKEGPGPRNGAQYGCPYRDEDWDDDSGSDTNDDDADDELENREEGTNVVGALTQVHTDKGKTTVPNDFERAKRFCVGSSSRSLPSDVDQSVNHGFPPTAFPGTLLSAEYGMFVDEILLTSLENEQARDIGVDGAINGEPSSPPNEVKIHDGWENFCTLEDFIDSDVGAHGYDFLANQNIQPDAYLNLEDCMDDYGTFEGSHDHDHDHSGPGQPSPSFGPMIPEGGPVSIFVGQQNLNVWISGSMLSWNGHLQEPPETEHPINDPLLRFSNFLHSGSSELLIPYPNQCSPVFDGSMRFNVLGGSGEYEPFRQHPHFSDGLGGHGFGDNVPYLSPHHHLASGPIGFGENVGNLHPHHQFAQGPVAFVEQSVRRNATSLHGPQLAEDSVGLSVQGFEENESHMNQHYQIADGSIAFHGQEASMNEQVDHHFDGVDTAAPFGIVQPPLSMPRDSPHNPS